MVCDDLIPPEIVRSWHKQVWGSMEIDRNDQRALYEAKGGKRCTNNYTEEARRRLVYPWHGPGRDGSARDQAVDPRPFSPAVGEVDSVKAVVDQLVGAGCWGQGMEPEAAEPADCLVFNWPHAPKDRQPWAPSPTAHIEMYRGARPNKANPAGWCHQFQLGAITYLEDVAAEGGGTHLVPHSHAAIHRYFCANPDDVRTGGLVGTITGPHRLTPQYLNSVCPGGYRGEPIELTMRAGSVCFWHHWMAHDSNYNACDVPRQAIFTRWHNQRPDLLEPTEIVLSNPLLDAEQMGEARTIRAGFDIGGIRTDGDLWKWWTPQVRAAGAAVDARPSKL
eukprot:COSAG06_NODE_2116_length_7557_cov_122.672298_1_plen_334_part_00